MKALLLTDYQQLEIAEIDEPSVGPRDVAVEVRACGICGSDIHGYDGSSGRRIPPLVMGHEAAGVVAAVGEEVKSLKVGERVTFDSTVSCGACRYCREGRVNLCDARMVLGVSCGEYRRHGAFAERVVVPEHICYRLPDALSFEQAALIEAVSIAVHAAGRAPVRLGDTAVIVGAGQIGLLCVQTMRLAGCGRVIAIDPQTDRLETAKQLGADVVFSPTEVDVAEEVRQITDGRGADVVLEVVGATETVQLAVDCTRKGGSLTLIGNLAPLVELPLQAVVTRELSLYGSCASSGEYPACIAMMERGDVRVDPLITAVAPGEEGPTWFARLYAGVPGAMKVVLRP